jgi:hypothetical protein
MQVWNNLINLVLVCIHNVKFARKHNQNTFSIVRLFIIRMKEFVNRLLHGFDMIAFKLFWVVNVFHLVVYMLQDVVVIGVSQSYCGLFPLH